MDKIQVLAPAKINLTLDVIGKRPDGYHEVEMVMQALELHDTLSFEKHENNIQLTCNWPSIPVNEKNLVYKIAVALKERTGYPGGATIHIHKEIPMEAGLAGGSSDAAAALKGLNELWNLKLSLEELMEIGGAIGADIPFCLIGGTALATGKGEKLKVLKSASPLWIVLAKPTIGVSTAMVYQNFNLAKVEKHPNTKVMINALKENNFQGIVVNLGNVLETVTLELYPELKKIKAQLKELGAHGVLMSGSGPTIFGIFMEKDPAQEALNQLSKTLTQVFLTKSQ
jgi:4-diphosphocytidyl-2-C-methyl-D-erythritol kinase